MFTIVLPPQVQTALHLLNAAGYSAYAVGGCVRDAMRGKEPHDWDLTTSALPEQMKACFSQYHVIETGIQHGTLTVMIDHMPLEITTYRIDGSYTDHRRPDSVTFASRVEDDLSRRDFTVNAMAYHPQEGLVDCFGGAADLQAGRIACVGDPEARFQEDGLRILRAMRFSSVLHFSIAPETAEAIHRMKSLLQNISAERIFSELTKLLCGVGASEILREYADVLFEILPALQPMYGFDQKNPHHCYDVYEHTLHVIDGVPQEPMLRWAALLHDAGKPAAFFENETGGHFYGHAKFSMDITQNAMHTLKSDRKTLDTVLALVEQHDVCFSPNAERILKRLVNRYGFEWTKMLLHLHKADVAAQAVQHRAERIAETDHLFAMIAELEAADACLSLKHLAVSGKDLMALGIPQGKAIGEALHTLLEQVMDGTLPNETNALLAAAQAWYANRNIAPFSSKSYENPPVSL